MEMNEGDKFESVESFKTLLVNNRFFEVGEECIVIYFIYKSHFYCMHYFNDFTFNICGVRNEEQSDECCVSLISPIQQFTSFEDAIEFKLFDGMSLKEAVLAKEIEFCEWDAY